jgi:hypothetical protein
MGTKVFRDVDLWIDEDELDELAQRLERILQASPQVSPMLRSTFFADYHEAE